MDKVVPDIYVWSRVVLWKHKVSLVRKTASTKKCDTFVQRASKAANFFPQQTAAPKSRSRVCNGVDIDGKNWAGVKFTHEIVQRIRKPMIDFHGV
ncbi:hypothetical protein D3C80_1787670 [compost metagenome]